MDSEDDLEIYVLGRDKTRQAVVLGRRGRDIVIKEVSESRCEELPQLASFRERIEQSVVGSMQRPSRNDLATYGDSLFAWLFEDEIRSLYDRLPDAAVSVQITSNWPELKQVPWEYLTVPYMPTPSRKRSVVRVLPGLGTAPPRSTKRNSRLRVLFVSADPTDQQGASAEEVLSVIERTYRAQLPDGVEITVIEAASRQALRKAIVGGKFDIFHFFGHGTVRNDTGGLILENSKSQRSDFIDAETLAQLLCGSGIRLALLSACLTAAGPLASDFGCVATGLIRAGLPAVVANQASIPTKTVAPFVGALYEGLLRTGNIDHAVMEGRIALAAELGGATESAVIEWGIPTLYRMAGAARIMRV